MTDSAPKPTLLGRLFTFLLLIALGLGTFVLIGSLRRPQSNDSDVQTVPVERVDLELSVSASGTIEPERFVNVSPKRAGIVEEVFVQEGELVQAGQIIATMDSSDFSGQLAQARAEVAAAQANLDRLLAGSRAEEIAQAEARLVEAEAALRQTEDTVSRDEMLFNEGAIPNQQLVISQSSRDRAQATVDQAKEALALVRKGARQEDVDQARARVESARGAVQTIEITLEDTVIRAPFGGTVTRRYSEPGSFVAPTSVQISNSQISPAIIALAGINQVVVNVAESDIRRLAVGQGASIRADAYPDLRFNGEITQIAPQAIEDQNVISFEIKLSILDDTENLLRPGMSVDVDFEVGALDNVLVVPTVSIVRQSGGTGVYIVDSNTGGASEETVNWWERLQIGQQSLENSPVFKPLDIGVTVEDKTEVRSGLSGGEEVYVSFPEGFEPDTGSLLF